MYENIQKNNDRKKDISTKCKWKTFISQGIYKKKKKNIKTHKKNKNNLSLHRKCNRKKIFYFIAHEKNI